MPQQNQPHTIIPLFSVSTRSMLSRPIPTREMNFKLDAQLITFSVMGSVPAIMASKSVIISASCSSVIFLLKGLIRYSIPAFSSKSKGKRFLSPKGIVVIKTFGNLNYFHVKRFVLHFPGGFEIILRRLRHLRYRSVSH